MASDDIHTAEISIRDYSTETVTLAPERATIVREITDVPIKPGPNEITIYGFDPEVDPDSLRVTGRGPATITDIQTLVGPQKDLLDDVFPQKENESGNELVEEEDPDDNFGVDRSELDEVERQLDELEKKLLIHVNDQEIATKSLGFLDSYGYSMVAKDVDVSKVEEYLKVYERTRARLGLTSQQSASTASELLGKKEKLVRTRDRLRQSFANARDVAAKPSREERIKKVKAKQLHSEQEARVRRERQKFWPSNVGYSILYLDGFGEDSPGVSSRNSIVSGKAPQGTTSNENSNSITLSLTYVTIKATWTPRYELMLQTPTSSGKVVYRAEYHNYSSETWKDAKITLSTSQTSFSGINENIPNLLPWNVKLHKQEESLNTTGARNMNHWKGGLENDSEVRARGGFGRPQQKGFGVPMVQAQQTQQTQQVQQLQQAQQLQRARRLQQARAQQSLQLQEIPTSPIYESAGLQPLTSTLSLSSHRLAPSKRIKKPFDPCIEEEDYHSSDIEEGAEFEEEADSATLFGSSNVLAFQESSRHDYGLTTSYDIPGRRTLKPSSNKRRHIIADLEVSPITFSHVIAPKLRPAAFLKANINNTSSTTLLKGGAGLTLDGAFLGTTTVPDCSPKGSFSLGLGVDPGIQVTYAKPTVRRATTGFFNKEDCAIFTRLCRINNTKGTAVSLTVYDQIPVSEDERLRIHVIEPKGIRAEGDSAELGADVCTNVHKAKGWGKGNVRMGKNGEVRWQITLEQGVEIKLTLEYDAKIPSGQKMVGLY